jgi:hypothetical protein
LKTPYLEGALHCTTTVTKYNNDYHTTKNHSVNFQISEE